MARHRRFFTGPEAIDGTAVTLTGPHVHQIGRVLRLAPGDEIRLLDGTGDEIIARITSISKDTVKAEVIDRHPCPREPRVQLTLAICLPKGDTLDSVIQSCTELGVSQFLIVRSERSVPRLDGPRLTARLERWRRIAREAAEQSGRGKAPEVDGLLPLAELAKLVSEHDLAFVAWEEEQSASLHRALHRETSILLVIGPEGGLTADEVLLLTSSGARAVSLGERLLRVETAAIAACAVLMAELG